MSKEEIEMKLYERLCKFCPNQKLCHDECETCTKYDEVYRSAIGQDNDN